ncbi:MAG TPA: SgcJ/EcaC family oxidoreductase [Chthoniobacterales bacterium]|nr:SgcJ/EcaC family oxidoreductase [Chthoniobacterales bacterium]
MKTQRNILIAATVFLALAASPLAATSSTCTPQQEADILALFAQWNRSLATGDAATVDANYALDAVLIPTLSNQIRHTPVERIAYFKEEFLPKKPSGKIDKHYLKCIGDIAINSGLYTFTFGDGTKASARYTFVYQKQRDGKWLIIEHHSSKMPKP